MTAEQIRKIDISENSQTMQFILSILLREQAAQLAELNEHIERITSEHALLVQQRMNY